MTKQISRRSFLKGSLAATGLTIVASATPFGVRLVNASGTKEASLKPSPLFEITPDNVVKFIFPNSEMGQGSKTGHTMILADELEADWDQIEVPNSLKDFEQRWSCRRNPLDFSGVWRFRELLESLKRESTLRSSSENEPRSPIVAVLKIKPVFIASS